jgi:aryl-alcohol dehydrogenase-like predicted oxidoreductase
VRRRRLGRTGLEISEIGFGCGPTAALMVRGTPEERCEVVARALDLGVNYFDTAPGYGNSQSEANLGRTLADLGARPVIATKVGLSADELGDIRGAVIHSVEASLERLGIKTLPLIQMHNRVGRMRAAKADIGGGPLLSIEDVLGPGGIIEAFKVLRARGLVNFFGCSAYGGEMPAVEQLIDSGEFDTIIVNYSMLNDSAWIERSGRPPVRNYAGVGARAAAAGMGAIALRVLEGGALVGDAPPPAAGARLSSDHQALVEQARHLRQRLGANGEALSATAVRFALSNPQVSCALVGISNANHVDDAAQCSSAGPLAPDVIKTISA